MRRVHNDPQPDGAPAEDVVALFHAHADTVAAWASRLGGPLLDVEDVVQEVFAVVHRRFGRYRREASVTTWLYGITVNVVREQRRKARRRRWFGLGPRDEAELAPPSQPTPVEEVERRRREVAVYRVLDAMGEVNRTVLILFELEGLGGEEIATLTGMRTATVWVRLHRAREEFSRLARKLMPDEVAEIETRAAVAKRRPR